MELKEYVCQTIVQICQGVKEAQKECAEMGAIVNPAAFVYKDGDCYIPTKLNQAGVERRVQLIEIDAMLTDSSSDTGGGHLGLGVSFMGVKIGGNSRQGIPARTMCIFRCRWHCLRWRLRISRCLRHCREF